MKKYPHLVADYIQYDNNKLSQPLQLQCAVNTLEVTESIHGKLTSIVRYWLWYKNGDTSVVLYFGLEPDVAVNSIIGIPTLSQ